MTATATVPEFRPAPCAGCDGRPGGCPDCVGPFDTEAMVRWGRDECDHTEEE